MPPAPPRSVLVVGAGLAGHATAQALRRQGYDGRVTVLGDETERPYDRTPLTKEFLAGRVGTDDLRLEADGEDLDVDWHLGVHAVALDPARRVVSTGDGREWTADAVVLAAGARARRLTGPAGLHTVRTVADSAALRGELVPGARLVVIGAGWVGAEVASTAAGLGLDVTVLEAAATPLAGPLGEEMGTVVAGLHARHGVTLRCGVPVAGVQGTDRVTGVELADGTVVPADVVVAGIGAAPAVDWLVGSGLDLSAGVVCSAVGATDAPGVYAVGDCSAWFDPVLGRPLRVEHWTDARERPAVLARLLLEGRADPPPRPPYFWSDQYGVRVQFAGRRHGDETVTVEAGDPADASVLAVYRRHGEPVAVLGMNQTKLFTRLRRSLATPQPVPAVP
ncbi:pyridine nucleotide-disulfide oxidoreductase [Nakamurella endophytica]|uniref:Pyridine nucleotide-disulfide oxidoreductase n=1 Tax=Nakamurella endophytica TaxID=1748367 RepID=A0A917WI61_9ACTN|nr:pyridine nucleotide-disulfide oxidoreductase [Nakamurella endophytica]